MSTKKLATLYRGYIKYLLPKSGFGYVRVPETREEFYFRTNSLGQLRPHDLVQFRLKETKQGLEAIDLQLISQI